MKFRPSRSFRRSRATPPLWRLAAIALALQTLGQTSAQAQDSAAAAVVVGERLSDWMLRNAGTNADFTALHWRVEGERAAQAQLRSALLQADGASTPSVSDASNSASAALLQFIQNLPITGRLSVAHHDVRWLQGTPAQDPVLAQGHSVVLLPRPNTVAVLGADGRLCSVQHVAGASAADYVQTCWGQARAQTIDELWLVQPDGRSYRYGVAAWSATAQNPPAPGAWIWAPERTAKLSGSFSGNLARFLATQLPAQALFSTLAVLPIAQPTRGVDDFRDPQLTASDWGDIGLLQTPTARMEKAGVVRFHLSSVSPYTRGTIMLQPLDGLEAGFRYTDISTRLYGPEIAGSQTYKDKSIDVKLRLWQESAWMPEVALGLRDLGGTGLFSSEYVVASKRWDNWDASLGLAWGYMGNRGNIKAPLGFLGESFKTRPVSDNASGGTANFQSMFHGNAAVIGGVQWHSPLDKWVLKAELDGNDYRSEPYDNSPPSSSPFNFGAVYRYSPSVDWSFGFEQGKRWMLGFTWHGAVNQLESPKPLDPVVPRIAPLIESATSSTPTTPPQWQGTAFDIAQHTRWKVMSIEQQSATLTLVAQTDGAMLVQDRVERAVAVLHRDAPMAVRYFVLRLEERGLPLSTVEIDRATWVAERTQVQPPSEIVPAQRISPGHSTASQNPNPNAQDYTVYRKPDDSGFWADWSSSYRQILGGPDGFILYQLGVQAVVEQRLSPTAWVTANVNLRLLDNYDNFKYDAPSNLPRVRTYAREFATTSRVTLPVLQATQVQDLGNGNYLSVYGGMLESMYGGIGAEWLYQPWQKPVAFGVDVNRVRQRDFAQNLAFRDYQVSTGHASLYWDTGWNDVQVKLMAGQYLAGDVGATVDVKRVFSNGVSLGAWATKTNVSKEQFGEGSFDKGVYLTIPVDLLLPRSSPSMVNVVWDPLTRDGGARLERRYPLFDLLRQRGNRAWTWQSSPSAAANRFKSGINDSTVLSDGDQGMWGYWRDAASNTASDVAQLPASSWLWGAGLVLAASSLDNSVDQWARDHQTDQWSRVGNASSNIPYALALGSGVLLTGLLGDEQAATAKTSLTAAAFTLAGNMVTKFAVGRARPIDGLGNSHFDGFSSSSAQSGFASNHVALAFALVTPFAQQYDQPWLYAVAGTTALGRVQGREHWFSDTVAGALMGYTIGSILSDQQLGKKRAMRLSVLPQSVTASWEF